MKLSFREVKEIARWAYAAGKYGLKSEEEACLRIMAGIEAGISPVAALRGLHDIKGKDGMDATLMRAIIYRSGKCKRFDIVSSSVSCTITAERTDGLGGVQKLTFTVADAINAGLYDPARTGKHKGAWEKYTTDLLLARCTSRVMRFLFADLEFPMHTPDELDAPETPAMLPGKPDVPTLVDGHASLDSLVYKYRTDDSVAWEDLVAEALVHGYTEHELREECEKQ